jgi:hypothetical protein
MAKAREPIHWAWLPAAAVFTASVWASKGPFFAIVGLLAGLGAGLEVRH